MTRSEQLEVTDAFLVEELGAAKKGVVNSIWMWDVHITENVLAQLMHEYDLNKPTTLAVALSLSGKMVNGSASFHGLDAAAKLFTPGE